METWILYVRQGAGPYREVGRFACLGTATAAALVASAAGLPWHIDRVRL